MWPEEVRRPAHFTVNKHGVVIILEPPVPLKVSTIQESALASRHKLQRTLYTASGNFDSARQRRGVGRFSRFSTFARGVMRILKGTRKDRCGGFVSVLV